ncbi:unnamed protein product, partial [Mesorhabditis spiculigera]
MNILLIMDQSSSTKGGFDAARDFIVKVAPSAMIGPDQHRIALIIFSGRTITLPWNFAKSNEELITRLKTVRNNGGITRIGKALEQAITMMEKRDTKLPTFILMVTDGCELDLVLVVDLSATTLAIYDFYKEQAKALVDKLYISPRHTRVAAVSFASVGKTQTEFSLRRYDTGDGIMEGWLLGEGIMMAMNQSVEREGARPEFATKAMVVFTDGWNNKGPDPLEAAKQAKDAGWEMYVVVKREVVEHESPEPLDEIIQQIADDEAHIFDESSISKMFDQISKRSEPCRKSKDGVAPNAKALFAAIQKNGNTKQPANNKKKPPPPKRRG